MLDTNYIEKLTGYSGSTVESVLEGFIKFVQLELRAGNEVEIPKFGVFYPKEFGERKSRNPRTGEHLIAKARTKPRLRFFDSFEKSIQDSDSTPTPPTAPAPLTIPPTIPPTLTAPASVPPPVPAAVSNRIWHIVKDGVAIPISESELKWQITPDTLVWTEGQDGWKSASEVPKLKYLFS
ncbi:DNA-binding protein HU-alpha, putative [Planktothrix agardhii CCAP 1459/11A]|uniref:DNA-binding protein HU-alpha, putative n=1 Tax=Planktothrix agardhii CCAP 1459/11A TaxID=282420 RepID=A0A4P5ZME3_PLAAG|nr:HU family DNA-binding protein [Planktothrix agardhii]GDZ96344.1 DNA-binding protein HU-alpha, putative [Planktothrix agardhii CCAP 1459/11A]